MIEGELRELPIGRRVAQWRIRRRLTQQMLADRLGKSKSWVDKVERGIRTLDRYSVIQDLGRVLRVDPVLLLGRPEPPTVTPAADGVEEVRAALARYDSAPAVRPAPTAAELDRQVAHAWLAYQHAHYPQLLRTLPALLDTVRPVRAEPAGEVYRVTAAVLVKLGAAELAWLAADRAMTMAAGDPLRAAVAAIPLGAALRALGRGRLALAATVAAADALPGTELWSPSGAELSVRGTLLVEGAFAAANCGDRSRAEELLDRAALLAEWRRLPAEHRGAYLVDVARAFLLVGDVPAAGRTLVELDRTAPDELRSRPFAGTVLAAVLRGGAVPAEVLRLAQRLPSIR
ncbi:hypothetical protein GCM10012279_34400 [Micromonospora yangpuensis]|uniref:Helix-turn-helix domain-containing protein n=1 Tax=Micromonospora yangpuensis TaxID=683228 RepID=A0A1C6VCM1_9ACTN|nr:hypothetical protein GCM10012279_34400 [Micromonospora yangpuensis]SCL64151.1 Helix-turn-helix domain-containing protein [Micromonospora yangpuensis]